MRYILSAILLAAGLLAGCGSSATQTGCATDSDCPSGLTCMPASGQCKCTTDDVCGQGQYCNPFGTCQERPPCLGNQDCGEGQICNSAAVSGGDCIPASTCGSSVQCELNHFCDPETRVCEVGCRNTGDCQLGLVCVAQECVPLGANCATCPVSPTPDARYCDYGEYCTTGGDCMAHATSAGLCATCGQETTCGDGLICLIDDETASSSYCAPGCTSDLDCPNGFSGCGGLRLVTTPCTGDAQCGGDGRVCVGDAEGNQAFCSCAFDSDCALDLCVETGIPGLKGCYPNGEPCTTGADCPAVNLCESGKCAGTALPCNVPNDCNISCIMDDSSGSPIGSCITNAKACGKESGLTCDTIRNDPAICHSF